MREDYEKPLVTAFITLVGISVVVLIVHSLITLNDK